MAASIVGVVIFLFLFISEREIVQMSEKNVKKIEFCVTFFLQQTSISKKQQISDEYEIKREIFRSNDFSNIII